MADAICSEGRLRITDIACGWTRSALSSLEPGAKVWLTVESVPVLFERLLDGAGGLSNEELAPIGGDIAHWRAVAGDKPAYIEIEFEGRPGFDMPGRAGMMRQRCV